MISSLSTIQSLVKFSNSSTESTGPVTIPNKKFYYSFENITGGTTIINEWNPGSINGNARTSATISSAISKFGTKSALFTGTVSTASYPLVLIPYSEFFTGFIPSNGFSISMWIRKAGTFSSDTHLFRFFGSDWPNGGMSLYSQIGTNGLYEWGNNFNASTFFYLGDGTSVQETGVWYHIVLIMKFDKKASVYVNGVPVKNRNNQNFVDIPSCLNGGGVPTSSTPIDFQIGGLPVGNPNSSGWNGNIDEVKCYNKILTQSEITALYTNTDL